MQVLKIDSLKPDSRELARAADCLQNGGVIAYPTETVYGLGASVADKEAVERVFRLKGRDKSKPFSVMISSLEDVGKLCDPITQTGKALITHFWPGPLTLIFNTSTNLPNNIVGSDRKIGLRMPDHPISRGLMKLHHTPVTCTSANLSGEPPAQDAEEVANAFGDGVDLIIDGGRCKSSIASTVVDVSTEELRIVRVGAIAAERIQGTLEARQAAT